MAILAHCHRRDHRHDAGAGQRVDDAAVNTGGFSHETQVHHLFDGAAQILGGALHFDGGHQTGVLAADAHGAATGLGDVRNDFLVDAAGQHHFRHFSRGRIRHAQAIDKAALNPQPLQQIADLRPAAVHHHRVDAHGFEQHDILGKILRAFGIAHRVAAIFHHEGLAGIALQIGQRLDQRFRLGQHVRVGGVCAHGNSPYWGWPGSSSTILPPTGTAAHCALTSAMRARMAVSSAPVIGSGVSPRSSQVTA